MNDFQLETCRQRKYFFILITGNQYTGYIQLESIPFLRLQSDTLTLRRSIEKIIMLMIML